MTTQEKIEQAANRFMKPDTFIRGANHVLQNLTDFDEVRDLMSEYNDWMRSQAPDSTKTVNDMVNLFLASKNAKG